MRNRRKQSLDRNCAQIVAIHTPFFFNFFLPLFGSLLFLLFLCVISVCTLSSLSCNYVSHVVVQDSQKLFLFEV